MIEIDGRLIPVLDAHVHVFPVELIEEREAWLLRDHWFAELYGSPNSKLAKTEELLASMDASGVDRAILCGFPWSDAEHCRLHNTYMAASVAAYPDRLSWLGIAPVGPEGGAIAVECLLNGAVGMGEFNADAQGLDLDDCGTFASIAEACISQDRPVMIHASEPVGHVYPGKGEATPGRILNLARSFPNLRIVAAHWGGGLPFYELMPSVRQLLANVAYDSAATTYLYDDEIFDIVELAGSHEKVFFASDFPVLGQMRLMTRMRHHDWSSLSYASAVLGDNAARFYGLDRTL
jgi:uncharacterized protein